MIVSGLTSKIKIRKRILIVLFSCALLIDIGYSLLQHYHQPFDGDMAGGIVPSKDVEPILQNPLGLKVFFENTTYPNPNRFFSHWVFYQYFNTVPSIFQNSFNPTDSAYLSCALIKTIAQVIILILLSIAISGKMNIFNFDSILAAVLIFPLFQTNGYCRYMGIIDPATTYVFFYALPIALLLLYFAPLFLQVYYNYNPEWMKYFKILWFPLALIVSLSGPLNPGISLIIVILIGFRIINKKFGSLKKENFKKGIGTVIKPIPLDYYIYLVPISLFSIYSLILGQFNSINIANQVPLYKLYAKLPEGIFYSLTQKLGFPIIFILLTINFLIIKKSKNSSEQMKLLKTYRWIGLFSILYILLLPLGGYRDYRPYILRYDTILPITLLLIFIFGKTSLFVINSVNRKIKYWYLPLLLLIGFIFVNSDEAEFNKNDCQKTAINQISESKDSIIQISSDCNVLTWDKITNPEETRQSMELLKRWKIIDKTKLWHQE